MNFVQTIINVSTSFISKGGIPFGFFIIILESYIPILPLSILVALNINAFGTEIGIIISWLGTIIGSYTSYLLFYLIGNNLYSKINIKDISFTKITLLLTLPFTSAFIINILAGTLKIKKEKYLSSLIIGKTFCIIFWGYIGKSIIESITNIESILFILLTLLLAYIISKFVSKKWNIE